MKINVSIYKSNNHNVKSVWAGYQVDMVNQDSIPSTQSYIVQYYSEGSAAMARTNIYGNKYRFNDMVKEKLGNGFHYAGNTELETSTGVFKEIL